MNTELQHADWMYVEGEKSTENPLFTTAEGKFTGTTYMCIASYLQPIASKCALIFIIKIHVVNF